MGPATATSGGQVCGSVEGDRRALETTSLDRIRSDYPALLYPDDRLSLNGDGSFTPCGEKRSIVADYLGD